MSGKLIANGLELDLADNIPFPLNFSISDVKSPQQRKRNYSKTVKLVGTVNNMHFFSSTYQLSLTDYDGTGLGFDFDPTQRVTARYYKNGTLVFNGLLQLNDVTKQPNGDYVFSCVLFSNFIDLFMQLGDRYVSELGWQEYDHLLSFANVEDSWDTSVILNGVATSNFTAGVPDGFGYVYPLADYGFNAVPSTFALNNLVPMVYVKECIEKCFAVTGTTIDSDWLETDDVKSMLLGFEGGKRSAVTATELNNRKVDAESDVTFNNTKSYSFISGSRKVFRYTMPDLRMLGVTYAPAGRTTIINQNIYNQLNNVGIVIKYAGKYKLTISGTIRIDLDLNVGQTYTGGSYGFTVSLVGSNGNIDTPFVIQDSTGASFISYAYSKSFDIDTGLKNNYFIQLRVTAFVNVATTGTPTTISFPITTPTPISYVLDCVDGTLVDNATTTLITAIPQIKAKDFLDGMIKAHNLYISDPDVLGVVRLEPLQDFYQDTTEFEDWTHLIDHSKDIKILPASTIDGKRYAYSFQDEDDYDNERYKLEFKERYGNYEYQVQSTYQTGTRDWELPFGQAVPIRLVNSTIVLPRIVKLDKNNTFVPYKGKPKVYFYNGLKTGNWTLTNVAQNSSYNKTQYPSIHHFNDWENPTFDWNWGLPKRIYYGSSSSIVTDTNLFFSYHDKFVRELTGRDSKLVQAYAKLNPSIINKLDFSRFIMLNAVLFRLNEIKDFDSDTSDSCMIELVRIIEADSNATGTTTAKATDAELIGVLQSPAGVGNDVGVLFGSLSGAYNSRVRRGN